MSPAQRELICALAACVPGKGIVIPTSGPSPEVEFVFNRCRDSGWVEEISSGPIRVWKITDEGREALATTPVRRSHLYLVTAEC